MYISASNFLLEIMDHKKSWGRREGEFASYSNELYIFFYYLFIFCFDLFCFFHKYSLDEIICTNLLSLRKNRWSPAVDRSHQVFITVHFGFSLNR